MSSRIAQSKKELKLRRLFERKRESRAAKQNNAKPRKTMQVPAKPKTGGKSELLVVPPFNEPSKHYVPIVQQTSILLKHIMRKSLRQIAREEKRDVGTVARVLAVHADEEAAYAPSIRALYLGLAPAAIACIKVAIENGDTVLAAEVLANIGVTPSKSQDGNRSPLLNFNRNLGQPGSQEEKSAFSRLLDGCSPNELMRLHVMKTLEERAMAPGDSADTIKLPERR